MGELEKNLNKKLTIINFEKLKGTRYPTNASPHSFIFQIKVNEITESDVQYIVSIEYGTDALSKTMVEISREIAPSSNVYLIETWIVSSSVRTHFRLSQFETPHTFLKELTEFIKLQIDQVAF